jgi:hypothetical protein
MILTIAVNKQTLDAHKGIYAGLCIGCILFICTVTIAVVGPLMIQEKMIPENLK